MAETILVLTISSATLAILHSLLPDHEIPLAMIGRAHRWSIKRMAGVTLIAGVIHISVSMAIGAIAIGLSSILAQQIALSVHRISGIFLIGFGLIYSFLAWKRKHVHGHSHAEIGHQHPHSNNHADDDNDDQHTHPDEHDLLASATPIGPEEKTGIGWGTWLAAIVGIAPCFTLIPVLINAMWFGTTVIMWVMFVYAISTIGAMVILTTTAMVTIAFLTRLEKIERRIEILAGLVIFAVGLYVVLPELLFPAHRHI